MGFRRPELPVVDFEEWSAGDWAEKIRPMARHWAEIGFGTPTLIHLLYLGKIALYVLGGVLVVLTTPGIDGLASVGQWWAEPIVFQKVVLYTMAFEVLGFGCGFGPLNHRYLPPLGSFLYWLRPNTIRLPPWPNRVPLTAGDNRGPGDIGLYAALLGLLGVGMFSQSTGVLPIPLLWAILIALAAVGLRDKVIFLAARGEVYGSFTVAFLFAGHGVDMIIAAKCVCLVIWLGAAVSKFNRHFPFVISTMMANSPVVRPRALKRRFFERFPDDLRPGRLSRLVAHVATAVELVVPLALFFGHGGWPTTIAASVMVGFHLGILTAVPMGVPLEWNVFMIFCVLTLFVGHSGVGLGELSTPLPLLLAALLVTVVTVGNLFPRKVSFLPGMRYYAGNWDTSLWCLKPSASAKITENIVAIAAMPAAQLEKFYGSPETAQVLQYLGYAFRCFNTHGRMMYTLAHRARRGPSGTDDESAYVLTDGERLCSTAVGWNFGDGHMHNEQLIAALHRRCHFEPGEVRVVLLDAQPIHIAAQRYRLLDAATGEFENGYIRVADAVHRQPWDDHVPVHPTRGQQEAP